MKGKHLYFAIAALFVLFLFLLCRTTKAGSTLVTSLPHTVTGHSGDDWDTLWIDGTSLTADSGGIKFSNVSKWLLRGMGDTIFYCNSATMWRTRGIELHGTSDSIIIDNIHVIQIAQGIDTTADWSGSPGSGVTDDTIPGNSIAIAMTGVGSHHNTVQNCYAQVNGYNSQCIYIGGYGQQVVKNTACSSISPGYRTRATYDGAAIKASGWKDSIYTANGYDFHFRIEGVRVGRSPHSAIVAQSFSSSHWFHGEVESCTLTCDAWNIMYPAYDGSVQHGTASTYGIHFLYGGDDCLIKNNRVLSGSAHKGGRGVYAEGWTPSAGHYATVCSNYVNVHEGTCVCFTGTGEDAYWPCGGKIRSRTANTDIYDNTVIYTADGSVPEGTIGQNSNSYSPHGSAMTYQNPQCSPPYNVTINNNLFRTLDLDSSIGVAGVKFDEAHCWDASWDWRNNRVETPQWGYKIMGYEGSSSGNRVINGDTLKIIDTTYNTDETYHWAYIIGRIGAAAGDADSNFFRDMVYEDADGAAIDYDTNITFVQSNQLQDIWQEITCSVYVTDLVNAPVSGSDVWVINDYTDTVLSGQTNVDGIVTGVVTYNYESRTLTDSLLAAFWPFVLKTKKSSDSASSSLNLKWDLKKDTLQLAINSPASYIKFIGVSPKGLEIIQ